MGKRKLRLNHVPGRPLMLDLFSGAGGTGMGLYRGQFNIVGVDVHRQPNYPFEFIQADVVRGEDVCGVAGYLEWLLDNNMRLPDGRRIDAVSAGPPCQTYSDMTNCRPGLADEYPDLIGPTRELLNETGLPWVMENVRGALPWMKDPMRLCGQMFGLELYRHRFFESNVPIPEPPHPKHVIPASKAAHWREGTIMSVCGHFYPIEKGREVMGGIDWMNRDEIGEAVPPPYTQYIAPYLLRNV